MVLGPLETEVMCVFENKFPPSRILVSLQKMFKQIKYRCCANSYFQGRRVVWNKNEQLTWELGAVAQSSL